MSHISSAVTGRYDIAGRPEEADCVQVHSFGTGDVNRDLAITALSWANPQLPIMADENAAEFFLPDEANVFIAEGGIDDEIFGKRPGTWGALQIMGDHMRENGLDKPLLIGHAHHIGRIVLQARKQGMDPIVPMGLPYRFNHSSRQIWTKYLALWVPYEMAARVKLKRDGQL